MMPEDEPSFSDQMRAKAEKTWAALLGHRFFREVAADAVEGPVFLRYLCAEHCFVDTSGVTLGYAVAKGAGDCGASPSRALP